MKKNFWALAILLAIAQGAWAWEGSGTESDPYLIQNIDDWKSLSYDLAHQKSHEGVFFRLTADLDLEGYSLGGEMQPFSGTFDGDGHTLTYDRGGARDDRFELVDDYCAPFVRLDGATIRHLNVTGAIYSNHKFAASIASIIDGDRPTTIVDCHADCILYAGEKVKGDATFGGLIGYVNASCKADPTIKDCTFTGRITMHAACSGGLVGWTYRPIRFENCVFDPRETPYTDGCATFVRTADGVQCTFEKCYRTILMGTPQGEAVFSEVLVPDGCKAEIVGEPLMTRDGRKYYTSGAQVQLTVPEGTPFDHWVTEGAPGCFVSDPWTASGVHTLSDVRSKPMLTIATAAPQTVKSNAERYGVNYRYLSKRDYLLFMSDSLREARGYKFDSEGSLYVTDAEGTDTWVTVVWNCDPDEMNDYFYRDGWFWKDKNFEGCIIFNDLVADSWLHSHLFAIAPRAFQGVKQLKHVMFLSDISPKLRGHATMPLDVAIQEGAFKDSGIEELVMVYRDEEHDAWVDLGPTSGIKIAADAFEGTDGRICVAPKVYQAYMGDKSWRALHSRINIYAAKVEDMKVEGAVYSYWRDSNGEPLKNNDVGHRSLMEMLRYWNADYKQFNAASLLSTSSKNIWYTQVVGADDDYLRSNKGVMRIYNDPGSQYNYKTLAIQSLGQSKEVKEIEFYQTNGLSDNSYTEPKIVIQNGALKGCDNLRELRLFYYVEDGEDRWTALGPKDVIPGGNIFGLKKYSDEELLKGETDYSNDPKPPLDLKILVSADLYPQFLEDPNWIPYIDYLEPVDFSPTTKKDFDKGGLTYGYMANPGGILQTSQTVSQDVSWWTAPRIAIEVALMAYTLVASTSAGVGAADQAVVTAKESLKKAAQDQSKAVANQIFLIKQSAAFSAAEKAAIKAGNNSSIVSAIWQLGLDGKNLVDIGLSNSGDIFTKLFEHGIVNQAGEFTFWQSTIEQVAEKDLKHMFEMLFSHIQMELDIAPTIASEMYTAKIAAEKALQEAIAKAAKSKIIFYSSQLTGAAAAATSSAGFFASQCWGGSGTYNADNLQKGMRNNILSNMHQVGLVGGGYVITTPNKNIVYHTYVKNVPENTKDAVIYAGVDDDNNSNTSARTMTFAKKAFQNHKELRAVRFHSMEEQTSNAGLPMLITIPDSAFVGCDNLVEFSTLLEDNEGGTRPLGPESFILAGDSIFAGLDSTKFHIVIDPSRKQDFLDNESWAPLKRFFTYRDAKPKTKFNQYGAAYAYSYENNSIKRENKVMGHLIEHTIVTGPDDSFIKRQQGAVKLCNDIGTWNNYQLDAVARNAFRGNEYLRVVNFTDLYGQGAFGNSYTGLEMALGDSCFADCKNLEGIEMLYLATDGDNHIDLITPQQVKIGKGVFDGTDARIKMMPQQVDEFMRDSSWVEYKERFTPCIIKPGDEGIRKALSFAAYADKAHEGNDPATWDEYIDLMTIAKKGFNSLNTAFIGQSNKIISFADFKHFESLGLDSIGPRWFIGCKKLSNIMLPQTIKTIHQSAFYNCETLSEIDLPAAVSTIGETAFYGCKALKTIVVHSLNPATLGEGAFPKNAGMKIYVPAESLSSYLKAWAEYKDYIVADDFKVTKVVKLDKAGTLAEKLGLEVEFSYSGLAQGYEPEFIHRNYAKYDSLTISGPINNLDIWVIRYLAGCTGYEAGGAKTDGQLRYLNLYDASIPQSSADYMFMCDSYGGYPIWYSADEADIIPYSMFYKCEALESIILPKSVKSMNTRTFFKCPNLKRIAITGSLMQWGYSWSDDLIDRPLPELVILTDGHATGQASDPWGQPISAVYTTQAQFSNYLNEPTLIAQTQNVVAPFQDDAVWQLLTQGGEFFPSVFFEKEDVGTIFSERDRKKALKTFDEFQHFNKVKELHGTFRDDELLTRVSLPMSLLLIGEDAFEGCRSLKTITMKGDDVPELAGNPFKSLPADYVIYVPRNAVKAYRTTWVDYADHINPEGTAAAADTILTVILTEPNTLAQKLGLTTTEDETFNKQFKYINSVVGDYSNITRLKVVGPITGSDLSVLRYLAGFCPWSNTRNYAGRLEYIDLYDAQLRKSDYSVAIDMWHKTTRDHHIFEDNVLPAYAFLQAYNLRTLILPKTCKRVQSRALQQCEAMETLVLGDDMEEFNWNALDDDASLTRMYILANRKIQISTENTIWRWLCNNYNPTFDAFYVRPSQYQNYLTDNAYTGSSWQRTNNISTGIFTDDDDFTAFAAHGTATADELVTIKSVNGWFDAHPYVKDLTALRYTMVDTLSKATLAPLTRLEKVAMPATLRGMEDGLLANAKGLRYADFLFCDSTQVVSALHDGSFKRLGIDTDKTLVYVPEAYGESDGTNVVAANADGSFSAKAFRMVDSLDYMVPYAFSADSVVNTRALPTASVPYTVCVPYKLNVPAYARAYQLSERSGNTLVFKEVKGELEAMHPYLLKVVGNKRLRVKSTTLDTDIQQTIPANGRSTYGRQDDAPGYALRGTLEGFDNQTAGEMGAYILQSDGDWHPVRSSTDEKRRAAILPFRAFLLPRAGNVKAQIGMHLEDDDTDGIDTIETIDEDDTHRYYDLSGRELPGKPSRGIYIHQGKKYLLTPQ